MTADSRHEPPRRRIPANLLALMISLFLSFAVGEVVARAFFPGEVMKGMIEARLRAASGIQALIRPHPDPEIYYELVPSSTKPFLGKTVRTDADGARIEVTARRTPAPEAHPTALVVGLGDSSMFGWGVNQRETYLHRLEARLNRSSPNTHFEVRNFAVPGYNSEQLLAAFEKKVLPTNPTVLVLHYDHNDPDPIGTEYLPDYITPETGDNMLHSALVKLVVRRLTYLRNENRIHVQGDHRRLQNYIFEGPAYDRHLDALAQIGSLARGAGILVYVVVFDAWIERAPDRSDDPHYQVLHGKLIPFLQENGMAVIDLYDVFQAYMGRNGLSDTRTLWVAPDDGHPNRRAHAMIADAVYEALLMDGRFSPRL
jgi:lysophospholipase L1-like esterase